MASARVAPDFVVFQVEATILLRPKLSIVKSPQRSPAMLAVVIRVAVSVYRSRPVVATVMLNAAVPSPAGGDVENREPDAPMKSVIAVPDAF